MQDQEAQELQQTPEKLSKDALKSCLLTHHQKMEVAQHKNPTFRTTSSTYGGRRPLEMFGVGGNGIVASRSKEPVGNGTKVYSK